MELISAPHAVLLLLFALAAWGLWRVFTWSSTPPRPIAARAVCLRCGTAGAPRYHDAGSDAAELLLWILALLPGLIYHLWRKSNSRWECPRCGSRELVPEDSPRAQQIAAQGR